MKKKPVLVTTKHRGVFAGLIDEKHIGATSFPLEAAKMAIYWGTTKGLLELAQTGPTSKSKISAQADIPMLHDVTAVLAISEEAWQQWQKR